jgi:hypothetical protein
MVAKDLEIFYRRWLTLDQLIDGWIECYSAQAFPRRDTVVYLLKSLQAFARGQFPFFYYGLQSDHRDRFGKDARLKIDTEFPTADILTGVLEQIGHDLELIRRAADQRISGSPVVRQTLANADKLAWIAVKPAIDYAAIEEATTVLTYFEKAAKFYRIPYAQVALISIPLTCASTEDHRDFLAIAHEVGHYVYRHPVGAAQSAMTAAYEELDGRLKRKRDGEKYRGFIKAIFEETFADIYGCLIGGPVMALDFMDLSLAKSNTDLAGGDDRHAHPAIRPLIYCKVLKHARVGKLVEETSGVKCVWGPVAEKLEDGWMAYVKGLGVTHITFTTSGNPIDSKVIVETHSIAVADVFKDQGVLGNMVETIVDTIIVNVLDFGKKNRPKHNRLVLQGWAGQTTEDTAPEDLYRQYEGHFPALLAGVKLMAPEADPDSVNMNGWDPKSKAPADGYLKAHTSQLWLDWVNATNNGLFNAEWPPAGEIEPGKVKEPTEAGKWGYILHAGGWTTDGPGPDMGHPAR